jgi:hypothetical protein
MAVFVYEVARVFLRLAVALQIALLVPICAQTPPPNQGDEGFRRNPELEQLSSLLESKHYDDVRGQAARIIHRPPSAFKSPKYEQFVKANALNYSAEASARLGRDQEAQDQFQQAADRGLRSAYFQVAGRFTLLARDAASPEERRELFDQAQTYYLGCAELGDPDCMDILAKSYERQNREDEENYWFLIKQMTRPPVELDNVFRFYKEQFKDKDRDILTRVMHEMSLSGGELRSSVKGLPGRSTLTSAFVDNAMRRQLEFTWRAFFSPLGHESSVYESFKEYRSHVPSNPFARAYLLIAQPVNLKDATVVSLPSTADLASNLQNGDEVFVRCGPLTHAAVLWSRSENHVLILDPFFEFWQPSHNACMKSMKLVPYRYKRDLVELPYASLRNMLEGVITIRDLPSP